MLRNETPRILRVLNRLNVGGPVVSAAVLTRHLAPDFETLLVAGPPDAGETAATALCAAEGIEPLILPQMRRSIHPLRDVQALAAMRRLIRRFQPHIVHTHAAKAGLIGRLAAVLEGVPIRVHTYEGHVFHSYFGPLRTHAFLQIERTAARYTHRLIAISARQQHDLCETYRIAPPDRFRIVRNGYDLSRFAAAGAAERAAFRQGVGLPHGWLAVGIVGRLAPVKNHALFVEAFARVVGQVAVPVVGVVVGDGELRAATEAHARSLGLPVARAGGPVVAGGLLFTSWRQDMERVYAGLDVVALSSLNEGNPVTLIEAQAAGVPVVATDVGGVGDTLADGQTGRLVPSGNAEALAAEMAALLSNPDLRHRFGAAGRPPQPEQLHRGHENRLQGSTGPMRPSHRKRYPFGHDSAHFLSYFAGNKNNTNPQYHHE